MPRDIIERSRLFLRGFDQASEVAKGGIQRGDLLNIERECDNNYDKNAVKVTTLGGDMSVVSLKSSQWHVPRCSKQSTS